MCMLYWTLINGQILNGNWCQIMFPIKIYYHFFHIGTPRRKWEHFIFIVRFFSSPNYWSLTYLSQGLGCNNERSFPLLLLWKGKFQYKREVLSVSRESVISLWWWKWLLHIWKPLLEEIKVDGPLLMAVVFYGMLKHERN